MTARAKQFMCLALTLILAVVLGGCGLLEPKAETVTPDGRPVKAPASTIEKMEYNWSRERQLEQLDSISQRLLARPDSDGNVSAEGEAGHNWKQAMVARDMRGILEEGTNPYDEAIVRTRERHQTGRAVMYVLAPDLLRYALHGEAGAVGDGGTYIKQNNRVEGSTLSASGDLRGGRGGPGGEAPGGDGAPAEGGSRSISIGGIGNMANSQDAYNGFQSRFNEILHGQGTIGKQPQAGFGDGNEFAPVDDRDEGSMKLF